MADLTAEWCRELADDYDLVVLDAVDHGARMLAENYEAHAATLRIAAAVLDERSVEGVARALCAADGLDWDAQSDPFQSGTGTDDQEHYRHAARAVLSYLKGVD